MSIQTWVFADAICEHCDRGIYLNDEGQFVAVDTDAEACRDNSATVPTCPRNTPGCGKGCGFGCHCDPNLWIYGRHEPKAN